MGPGPFPIYPDLTNWDCNYFVDTSRAVHIIRCILICFYFKTEQEFVYISSVHKLVYQGKVDATDSKFTMLQAHYTASCDFAYYCEQDA